MMGPTSTICWAFLLLLVVMSEAKPHYLIYAPEALVPGQPFNVSVTLMGQSDSQSFVRAMIRNNYNKTEVEVGGPMNSYSTAVYYMYIPEHLAADQYNLYVTSDGDVNFDDFIDLQYEVFTVSIFIQTDKPIYKPGEIVHFRVFSLNPDMKTIHSPMNISIYDSKKNLLGQWLNEVSASGVVSRSFELSDQPLLDEWVIKVWHKGQHSVRTFKVEEYVLPRFEVTTEVTPFLPNFNLGMFHLLKRSIQVKVKASYTQNKPVRGFAVVSISSSIASNQVTKSKEIYGEGVFDIKIEDLFASTKESFVEANDRPYWDFHSVYFNVSVTEALTDKTIYAKLARTEIVAAPVDIRFTNPNNNFKGGLTSQLQVLITRRDGKRLLPQDYSYPLDVTIKSDNHIFKETTYNIPKDGNVLIDFDPPLNSTSIVVDAKYKAHDFGVKYKLSATKYLQAYQTQNGDNMQVTLLTNNITAGDMVKFRVESTQPMGELIYTIFAKGILLSSFQIDAQDQQKLTIAFKANSTMCPKARILVSFVTNQDELIIDSVDFYVQGIFKHSVDVQYNVRERAPGQEVSLKMTASSGSYVFVGAVDKSVLLLESPNDITYDLVLGSVDKSANIFPLWHWGGESAGNMLDRLGLVYMTSLDVYTGRFPVFMQPMDRSGEMIPVARDNMKFASVSEVSPPKGSSTKDVKVRSFFPETWIWEDVQIGAKGYETINRVTPGTITTWITTAFSIHPTDGLAILREPVSLRTFQNFYISLDLPYSVIRNEKFKLRIGIFNYLNTTEQVQVILEDSKYYKVYDGDRELFSNFTKFVEVKANSDIGVDFWLLANQTGTISLRVKAIATRASDSVQRNLLVEAEGYTVYFNEPFLVNVSPNNRFVKTFSIPMPKNIVNGSQRVELSVIGDVMGPSLNGLGNLVRMPHGCGEQNMINFAPNVYIYAYLKSSQLMTKPTEANIIRFTKRGYENELKFRHLDGSYSAFGEKDVNGSTWLTAFVVKCFAQARKSMRKSVPIEEHSVIDSLQWLLKQQLPYGRFKENGKVIHQAMQGGATKDIPMNAYILITLLETKEYAVEGYQHAVEALANNLKKWIDTEAKKDPYSLAILLYGMSLLGEQYYFQIIQKELDQKSTKEDGMQFWTMTEKESRFSSSSEEKGNVEISSYVLMAYTQQGMLREGIPIMKWLLSQRNSMGGYHSTQDTVLSLEALSKFAILQGWSSKMKVDVTAFNAADYSYTFPTITRDISTMLISHTFPSNTRNVTLTARGNGTALIQVAWQYNVETSHTKKHLRLTILDNSTDKDRMAIKACASWKGQQKSGMVLVQIGIPSGFVPETENLDKHELVRKTEFEGRNLVIYLEELTQAEFCFKVFANRNYLVLENQPQPVRVRLYYNPDEALVSFYTLSSLKSLDVHSWDHVGRLHVSGSNSVLPSLTHLFLLFLVTGFSLLI